jgi:hypothetical protein
MIQSSGRLGLPQKALAGDRVAPHFLREELYGDVAVQRCVPCQEDFAHASLTDFAEDPVMGKTLTDFRHRSLRHESELETDQSKLPLL